MGKLGGARRAAATAAAAVGWAALALQLALLVDRLGPALGAWRFLGYFTILTNIGVAAVASAVALGRGDTLGGSRARLMAATSIILVGIVYSVALRALWNPTGLQKLADFALHDAAPLLFFGLWVLSPHGALRWRDIGWALVPPALYAVYALGRGALDGWYAYWFLNPAEQSPAGLAASIAVMLAGFALIAGLLVLVDRWLGRIEDKTEAPNCKA